MRGPVSHGMIAGNGRARTEGRLYSDIEHLLNLLKHDREHSLLGALPLCSGTAKLSLPLSPVFLIACGDLSEHGALARDGRPDHRLEQLEALTAAHSQLVDGLGAAMRGV